MFNSVTKLLSVALFAIAVVAQEVHIAQPAAQTSIKAGSSVIVQLEKLPSSAASQDVAVVIGLSPCPFDCSDVSEILGTVLYSGTFDPQSSNAAGHPFQNFSVTLPNWFDGPAQLGAAYFHLTGTYNKAEIKFANTTIELFGAVGR